MDVELKTGGMARMPVGYDANTKRRTSSDVIEASHVQSDDRFSNANEVAAFAAYPTERSESRPAEAEHERG